MANPERRGLYMYPKTVLTIDNGQDKVSIDRGAVANELEQCGLSQEAIMGLLGAVNVYAEEVRSGLQGGIHVGSTSLAAGVESIFYTEDKNNPAAFGLQTSTELKLAAKLIGNACKKEGSRHVELGRRS